MKVTYVIRTDVNTLVSSINNELIELTGHDAFYATCRGLNQLKELVLTDFEGEVDYDDDNLSSSVTFAREGDVIKVTLEGSRGSLCQSVTSFMNEALCLLSQEYSFVTREDYVTLSPEMLTTSTFHDPDEVSWRADTFGSVEEYQYVLECRLNAEKELATYIASVALNAPKGVQDDMFRALSSAMSYVTHHNEKIHNKPYRWSLVDNGFIRGLPDDFLGYNDTPRKLTKEEAHELFTAHSLIFFNILRGRGSWWNKSPYEVNQ